MVSAVSAEARDHGFELGVRTGYAIPFGKGSSDEVRDLREGVSGTIPAWIDAGYRLTPHFTVALFGLIAPGFLGDAWDAFCERSNLSCSVRDFRAGVELNYHLLPSATIDPWV